MRLSVFHCVAVMVLSACGSSSSNDSGSAGSCRDICAHLATLCGPDANCATWCESLTASQRQCLASSESCASAEACGTPTGTDGGPTPDQGPPAADARQPCVPGKASASEVCHQSCTNAIKLPGGGWYCTVDCLQAADCTSFGDKLTCISGSCVPKCKRDQDCTALGFKRCDSFFFGCRDI